MSAKVAEEEAHVQIGHIGLTAKEQAVYIHHNNAGEIEQIESQCAPEGLHGSTQGVVTVQHQGHQQDIAVIESQRIGEQSPDLTVENGRAVKDQQAVENVASGHGSEQIHQATAQRNVKHQVGDTFITILITETLEAFAQVIQRWSLLR